MRVWVCRASGGGRTAGEGEPNGYWGRNANIPLMFVVLKKSQPYRKLGVHRVLYYLLIFTYWYVAEMQNEMQAVYFAPKNVSTHALLHSQKRKSSWLVPRYSAPWQSLGHPNKIQTKPPQKPHQMT